MKSKHFTIPVPIYEWEIHVSKQEKDEVLIKRIEKLGFAKSYLASELSLEKEDKGSTNLLSQKHIVIRLNNFDDALDLKKLIIHESHHASDYILTNIGMKFMMNVSDEAFTYLQDYICGIIFKKLGC